MTLTSDGNGMVVLNSGHGFTANEIISIAVYQSQKFANQQITMRYPSTDAFIYIYLGIYQ